METEAEGPDVVATGDVGAAVQPDEGLLAAVRMLEQRGDVTLLDVAAVQQMLEEDVFKLDLDGMNRWEWADFVRTMTLAANVELAEFLQEVGWKPWSSGDVGEYNRELALGELADALHFILNLLLAIGADGDDLARAYLRKVRINVERQRDGYLSSADKCPQCGRSLAVDNAIVTRSVVLEGGGVELTFELCANCGFQLSRGD